MSWTLPFQVTASAAVGVDGFFLADGWRPKIEHYGPDGGLARISRIAEPPRSVSQREFRDALEWDLDRWGGDQWGFLAMVPDAYAQLPQPVVAPSFQGLLVDTEGWLWAWMWEPERRTHDPFDTTLARQWMIFDPDGRAIGTVESPAGLHVYSIGSDYLLGVRRDTLGVELVEGYRLRRE
jgi:hypothetical protein